MLYYANTFTFKLIEEKDGWWSIYRLNEFTDKYIPMIQAKDLSHAKDYCNLCEPIIVPLKRI